MEGCLFLEESLSKQNTSALCTVAGFYIGRRYFRNLSNTFRQYELIVYTHCMRIHSAPYGDFGE